MPNSPRLLLYSFDAFGLGHTTRCLRIATAFQSLYPMLSTLLVTGSPIADQYKRPAGVQLLQIPSLTRDANLVGRSRDPRYSLEEARQLRRDLILGAVQDFNPDLFLLDHNPVGVAGEALPALEQLKKQAGNSSIALGMRDIANDADLLRKQWETAGAYAALEEFFDAVFVYGAREFYDPVSNYGLSERLQESAVFTGFISDPEAESTDSNSTPQRDGRQILLTLGGGEDGEQTISTFLDMISRYGSVLNARNLVVAGPLLPEASRNRLSSVADSLGVEFKSSVPSLTPYLRSSELVISMGGYNTTMEILTCAEKALIIPRVVPDTETLVRARRLKELGLAEYISAPDLTSDLLFEKIQEMLDSEDRPLHRARQTGLLPMNGAEVLARACEPLLFKQADQHRAEL